MEENGLLEVRPCISPHLTEVPTGTGLSRASCDRWSLLKWKADSRPRSQWKSCWSFWSFQLSIERAQGRLIEHQAVVLFNRFYITVCGLNVLRRVWHYVTWEMLRYCPCYICGSKRMLHFARLLTESALRPERPWPEPSVRQWLRRFRTGMQFFTISYTCVYI